jgi:ribosomal protein S27AE
MTTNNMRPNEAYPTCRVCGHGHREPDENGEYHFSEESQVRPSQCPQCPSASPPAKVENRWECLACGWFMYHS